MKRTLTIRISLSGGPRGRITALRALCNYLLTAALYTEEIVGITIDSNNWRDFDAIRKAQQVDWPEIQADPTATLWANHTVRYIKNKHSPKPKKSPASTKGAAS